MKTLSHLNTKGEAHMVDVSAKEISNRYAKAEGFVLMEAETLRMISEGTAKKGDVLSVARVAGIMGAKKTSQLIPLCHPLLLNHITIDFTFVSSPTAIKVESSIGVDGKTGVEMEALTAVSLACLTIYDMLKAVDREMKITSIHLIEKSGGQSGSFHFETAYKS
ncbi:MAG: cyclic pyranopterin monophosphate synthase MoaC [Hyphomicrobium sp.]